MKYETGQELEDAIQEEANKVAKELEGDDDGVGEEDGEEDDEDQKHGLSHEEAPGRERRWVRCGLGVSKIAVID